MRDNNHYQENKTWKRFWVFFKRNFWTTIILPFVIFILIEIFKFSNADGGFLENIKADRVDIVLEIILTFLFFDIPQFFIDEMSGLSNVIKEEMDRTKELSPFTVFHTENNVFGKKMSVLSSINDNGPKWIYSKFISRLLSVSFDNFKITFQKTQEYSEFSSDVMKECKNTISLTGSMTPYEWLFTLATDEENKELFFNNASPNLTDPHGNHAITLQQLHLGSKNRAVCLSSFDFKHLFLFEQSLKEYYRINNGVNTVFCEWTDTLIEKYQNMKPLIYEYAWYDETLLFKFDKKTRVLEVLKDDSGKEYNEIKVFFSGINDKSITSYGKDALLLKIKKEKTEWLKNIKRDADLIPHRYAYLFADIVWDDVLTETSTFNDAAKRCTADLFEKFVEKKSLGSEDFEIVEIGAGIGDKSLSLCDKLFTDKIKKYTLIDISTRLLSKSNIKLDQRYKSKTETKHFDCCDDTIHSSIYKDKTILILNNSTIFSEHNFDSVWNKLKSAKRIFITLHSFRSSDEANEAMNEYCGSQLMRKLLLAPLRIFGIPITKGLTTDSISVNAYFTDNHEEFKNDKDKPFYKIYFNLKSYLNALSPDEKNVYKTIGDYDVRGDEEYDHLRKEFDNKDKVVVLSSLKFNSYGNKWQDTVKEYFYTKLNDTSKSRWDIDVEQDGAYIGIWIERKITESSASTDNEIDNPDDHGTSSKATERVEKNLKIKKNNGHRNKRKDRKGK